MLPAPTRDDTSSRHREIVPFIVVGVVAVAIDFTLFNALLRFDSPVWLANGCALLISMTVAFVGNYRWTFAHREVRSLWHAYGTFTAINVAAVAFIEAVVVIGEGVWSPGDLWLNAIKAGATAVATVGRFLAYKRWVFF